jgi:acetolactate synthase I/II/III large subunit
VSRNTVADVIVDGLARAGTPRFFCAADERASSRLGEAARARGMPLTLASGAAAACVMASVSGDLVDAPGVALVGPCQDTRAGFAAIARAQVDRAPMIVLTERHASAVPACKASLGVTVETAAHWVAHASRLAMSEPRGPVHLDIPAHVTGRPAVPLATSCRPDPLPYPDASALDAAARALSHASRPLLLAGLHCRRAAAAQWLRAFAEALPAPLLTTARAKGSLPDPHPLTLGVLGDSGVDERLLGQADLVVAIGVDTHEPVPASCWSTAPVLGFGPPQALDDRVLMVRVLGDVDAIMEELAARLRDVPRADWDVADLDRMRREGAARAAGAGLAARVVRVAREATPAGTIATVDAGSNHACVAASWQAIAPREFLTTSGSAPEGFALPAALAAHLVHPDRRVVCFTDAAALAVAAGELETATRLDAPIVVVVLGGGASSGSDPVALARSFGLTAYTADGEQKFAEVLGRALHAGGPALIAVAP